MGTTMIGAARVVFEGDSTSFDATAKGVEGMIGRLQEKFHELEDRLKHLGAGLSVAITLPFAAMVRTIDKSAGGFEAQMKRVEAALGGVSGKQLEQLAMQARTLGPAVGKGATEAASGIEALGLAGVSTADILGGALKSTLDLAAAGMTDVEPAAALVTDAMGQFHKTAGQLPDVVRDVVGALDASKFGFNDFALAIAQGGGIAASSGVSFRDFATAIAATSSQFSSGADAGTSYKTYLQSLTPISAEAERAMKMLGINFYDASGRLKPLAEQAQILQDKLRGLTDQSKSNALKTIFGADAERTAIALMDQGREGIERIQAAIAKGDIDAKIAKNMEGSAAASQRIANAWESLKISLGDTGLLDAVTTLKNGIASMIERMAAAPPALLKFAAIFTALAAAIGPLMAVLGHVAAFLLARVAMSFGVVGRLIALLIAPISTLISLVGEMGLIRVLAMVGSRLLGLAGPIGWAIGAVLLFKDTLVAVLSQIWERMVTVLGAPLEAIFAKVQAIFSAVSGGPIGGALKFLISAVGGIADVIGTVLGGVLLVFGELVVRVFNAALQIISGFLDFVKGFVDLISALLAGDFSRAWEAAGAIVESVFQTLLNVLIAIVPDMELPLRMIYQAAKRWLADAFPSVAAAVHNAVGIMLAVVQNAFPGVVAAARLVYLGVKAWLVDNFGGILAWVGKAAAWIVDRYNSIKKALGLGVSANISSAEVPKVAAPVAAPSSATKRSVSFDDGNAGKKKSGSRGRDTTYDSANRDELKLQAELEAARLRNDQETVRAIERRLDLQRQIEAYQRTGLSLADATKAAERDMNLITAARETQTAREIEQDQRRFEIRVAELAGNGQLLESLKRQDEIQERITYWKGKQKSLTEATALATAEQVRLDAAVADAKERAAAAAEAQRQIELARTRGDSEDAVRRMETAAQIEQRTRDLMRGTDGSDSMDEASARAKAETEAMQAEAARRTGIWRDTIKGGFRAALDGNFGSWFEGWWKDRVAKAMENALNSLADLIAQLFSKTGSAGNDGLAGLGAAIGSLFGGKGGGGGAGGAFSDAGGAFGAGVGAGASAGFPGFATGGRFTVGGPSGIDRSLVAFRATRGEMVNITRPGMAGESAPPVARIEIVEHEGFASRVAAISDGISVTRVAGAQRQAARQGRQRLA